MMNHETLETTFGTFYASKALSIGNAGDSASLIYYPRSLRISSLGRPWPHRFFLNQGGVGRFLGEALHPFCVSHIYLLPTN